MSRTQAPPERAADSAAPDLNELIDEAETEAAEAEAIAAETRARAVELKRGDVPPSGRRRLLARPRWSRVGTVLAVLTAAALLVVCGLMVHHQRTVHAADQDRAEFVAAARQVVVTLMSIDFNNPQESVRQIVDNSTGSFRDEFQGTTDDFIRLAQDARVVTTATANAAAVESMTEDSAVVMVAVSSTVTNAEGVEEAPRNWRVTVDLQRDGDRIKMSKVEFVP